MASVVWLPGILGSNMGLKLGGTPFIVPLWVEPAALLAGGIVDLQLAADGVSPGPVAGGQLAVPTGIFIPAYGPMAFFLRALGHRVLPLGYDWRHELMAEGKAQWAAVLASGLPAPYWLVGHSQGGLIARTMFAAAAAVGQGGMVAGVITIGTPHFGSFEIVRLFYGLPPLYNGLQQLCGLGALTVRGAGPDWLAATVASWPGIYEFAPFAHSGPLWQYSPSQAALVYSPLVYPRAGLLPNIPLLGGAAALQDQLAALPAPPNMVCVAGVGSDTPWAFSGNPPWDSDAGYQFTEDGDGYVTRASASFPGARVFTVNPEHTFQPLDPAVFSLMASLIPL